MKELLEKFVALAPKEWGVTLFEVAKANAVFHKVRNAADDGVLYIDLNDDRPSAEAIVFLLDYLGEQGEQPTLQLLWSLDKDGGPFDPKPCLTNDSFCLARSAREPKAPSEPFLAQHLGKTRIEALVRACVALWEAKEANNG